MHPCEQAGHDVRHTAVRVPWNGNAPIQVEHECRTYGCKEALAPWLEEAQDPEGALLHVFGRRGQLGPEDAARWRAKEDLKARGHSPVLLACATGVCGHVPPPGRPPKPSHRGEISRAGLEERPAVGMDAVRDAPRPQVGATTTDPDDFLRRATATRPKPTPWPPGPTPWKRLPPETRPFS